MNTEDLMNSVRDYLADTYGSVKPEWEIMLMILRDTIEQYKDVSEKIKEIGIYNYERGLKNPLLSTQKDLAASIYKIVQHLGISPYSSAKIKVVADDDTDDFIGALTGEDRLWN